MMHAANRTTPAHAQPRVVSRRNLARRRPVLTRTSVSVRAQVAASFRTLANGVDPAAAHATTVDFYRSGGMDWARCLG
jgi:hypothetical protein